MEGTSATAATHDPATALAAMRAEIEEGRDLPLLDRLTALRALVEARRIPTLEVLLPALLQLRGQPYTLRDHFPFSPMFHLDMPAKITYKTGRQVAKTTTTAAASVVMANVLPYFNILFVTPLFEQVRRFSSLFIRPFIETSPVKSLWSDATTNNSVLQRSFKNQSQLLFSFAFLNADRIRGISASMLNIDELQDMDKDHIPIILETLSASQWKLVRQTGTPKTFDGSCELQWLVSSQAEWIMRCLRCSYWNVPSADADLLAMIGPLRDDICERRPGVVCARCRRPINPRLSGRWVHRYPEKRFTHAGYHIPQILLPMHYASPRDWGLLLAKQQGLGNVSPARFHNEVLGESYDTGAKLITLTELRTAASLPWANEPRMPSAAALRNLRHYDITALGIDWGGGGEDRISFTTLALLGMRSDGKIDVVWGRRLLTPNDHIREAVEVLQYWQKLQPKFIAHDFSGAGAVRESLLVRAGVPLNSIFPISYIGPAKGAPIQYVAPTSLQPRGLYRMDKGKSLLCTVSAMRLGVIRTFQYDHASDYDPGLLHDFLALVEEKVETRLAGDVYLITRASGLSDDFAHAVNIAACALWHSQQNWPDFASLAASQNYTEAQLDAINPTTPRWDIEDDAYFATP